MGLFSKGLKPSKQAFTLDSVCFLLGIFIRAGDFCLFEFSLMKCMVCRIKFKVENVGEFVSSFLTTCTIVHDNPAQCIAQFFA